MPKKSSPSQSAINPDNVTRGVRAIKSGDQDGITEFVNSITPSLQRYVKGLVGSDDPIADDIVQDTLVKITKKIRSFDESRPFSAWMYTIANNTFLDYQRKSGRHPTLSLEGMANSSGEESLSGGDMVAGSIDNDPVERAIAHETGEKMDRAINKAEKAYPEAVATWKLITLGNRKYHEAAVEGDIGIGTVKSRGSSAKRHIRALAEQEGVDVPPNRPSHRR